MQQLVLGGVPASQIPSLPRVENISCILPPSNGRGGLYLGNYFGTQNVENLKEMGIRAVLTTSIETPVSFNPEDVPFHKRIAAHDRENFSMTEYLEECIAFISEFSEITNVLVHCYAGMSRSTTIVIAYLMKLYRWGYDATLHFVKFKRVIANPNEGFANQLRGYESALGIVPKPGFPPQESKHQQPVRQMAQQPQQQQYLTPEGSQQPQRIVSVAADQNQNSIPTQLDNRFPPMSSPYHQMVLPRSGPLEIVGQLPPQLSERTHQPPVRTMHDETPIPKFGSRKETVVPPQVQQPVQQPSQQKLQNAKQNGALKGSKAGFIRPRDLPGYRAS